MRAIQSYNQTEIQPKSNRTQIESKSNQNPVRILIEILGNPNKRIGNPREYINPRSYINPRTSFVPRTSLAPGLPGATEGAHSLMQSLLPAPRGRGLLCSRPRGRAYGGLLVKDFLGFPDFLYSYRIIGSRISIFPRIS